MPKFTTDNVKKLLLKYTVCIIFMTLICLIIFSSVFSFVLYKFDLDLKMIKIFSVIVIGLSALSTSLSSISFFKNNYLVLSTISVIPLIIISLINLIVGNQSVVLFFIKTIIIFVCAIISALIKSGRKTR